LSGHFLHGGLALSGALVLNAFGSASWPSGFDAHFSNILGLNIPPLAVTHCLELIKPDH
jgi:hypothetical protein